jgi:uncharacterized Zn-finger protein
MLFMADNKQEVMCDGTTETFPLEQQFGHPRIYLYIQENGKVACPYCGKEFVYEPSGS